jgi:Fe-S oxidoreductase
MEVMRAARVVLEQSGGIPKSYRGPLGSLRSQGNPWSEERAARDRWAEELGLAPGIGPAAPEALLFFACCTQIYEPRNRHVARALSAVLKEAKVPFGVLDQRQSCCGDQARKVGAEELYQELRQSNRQLLQEAGARRILVSSPHCLQTLNGDYRAQVEAFQAVHHAQLLQELLHRQQLVFSREVSLKATYHDPCYLGRHGGEYEAPREVLRAISGLKLLEMPRNRDSSLCCGGGGGGLWREVPPAQRFAAQRIREAQATGAEAIITACPYCIVMFEDGIKVLGLEETMAVFDLAEIVAQAMGLEP